jgi:type IX secretion system PorP/SprF family membrane protein
MKIYKSLYIIIGIILTNLSFAQDFHFSQYNENPSLINPALTASRDAMRASVVYKNQWKSVTTPFTTYGASFDTKFKPSNWEQADKFRQKIYKRSINKGSAGISFYNDRAGDGKLTTTNFNISLATFVKLNEVNKLSFGVQGSFTQRKIDYSQLIFPNQYNGTIYDPSTSNLESYNGQNIFYPDLAAGIAWCYGKNGSTFTANSQKYANLGFSIYHMTRPNQSFIKESGNRLDMRYNLHGNFSLASDEQKFGVEPSFLVQLQGKNVQVLAGSLLRYFLSIDSKYTGYNRRSAIGLGVYYRNQDAMITSLLLEYKAYAIGVSYDLNISQLRTASSYKGGMEITIRYTNSAIFLYQKK